MAEVIPTTASVKAPPKKKIFGELKKPDLIIYRLLKTNDVKLRDDTPLYPPYIRFPNYDIIEWEGGTRAIRWLPGEQSIFVDEQEINGRKIPDNIIHNPNNRFEIINGEIRVQPHQKTKIEFLDFCNRNVESQHRTGSVAAVFSKVSEEKKTAEIIAKQQLQKIAMEKAFSADEEQIAFHAKYFGIPIVDPATSASRTFEAIQADYRQIAMDMPDKFLKTYDDEDLKLKYKINLAISDGTISMSIIPGKAVISASKEEISDVPITTDLKQIVDTLFLFSQTSKGVSFLKKVSEFGG